MTDLVSFCLYTFLAKELRDGVRTKALLVSVHVESLVDNWGKLWLLRSISEPCWIKPNPRQTVRTIGYSVPGELGGEMQYM